MTMDPEIKKNANEKNAAKQKRFRDRQKDQGKKLVRGYINKAAADCYSELSEKTGWTDSELLSNSLRITLAAYRNGQIKLLNEWLKKNNK